MIVSGYDGSVFVNTIQVLRCTRWSGTLSRSFIERTPRAFWDKDLIPGKRLFSGEITAFVTDAGATFPELETGFTEPAATPVLLELWVDRARTRGISCEAYLESTQHQTGVNEASQQSYTVISTGPITSTL